MNYKPESKRTLNNELLNCFNQNAASLQISLTTSSNPAEVSKEALRVFMLNSCPQQHAQLIVEEENRQLTLTSSDNFMEHAIHATCQCLAKGNSLATCQKALVDLNEDRINQHFKVTNSNEAQSEFSLNVTLGLLDRCDMAESNAELSVLKSFNPVTGICASTIAGDFRGGDAAAAKTILFDKQNFKVKSGNIEEEFSLLWDGCSARLTCLKTNSDKSKKGDKNTLTILRSSEQGFMGVYETPTTKELVNFKARPRLKGKALAYLGQQYLVGQKISIDSVHARPIQHIQYFDPVKLELVTIPSTMKIEGSISDFTYNKKLDQYWIVVTTTRETALVPKSIFIDVEGAQAKKEFIVK